MAPETRLAFFIERMQRKPFLVGAIAFVMLIVVVLIVSGQIEPAAKRENDLHYSQNWPQEKLRAIEKNNMAYYRLAAARDTCRRIPLQKLQEFNEERDMECISLIRALTEVEMGRYKNETMERRAAELKGLADALETKPGANR